ncbi:hypothetical protein HOT99_gp153 [Caulobacter phage CcrBL10]|uniref:Uncharacterized protein n=1 Tax=Caulobacter phage CcrBL10 TaxID=2283269 RepID=A0A385E9E3_9CAUD|nr:hypothetical protein HOT99_gp153 [Caulobacter phage CcrBL10]AXQ68464.1 hypothetical protein CcrBL10_gp260 [Caulobacter phage CcrBL10]
MSFVDRMRAYLQADLEIVKHFTERFFAKRPDEPDAGVSPQPMKPAPPGAGMGSGTIPGGGGGGGNTHFYYPGVGGGGGYATASGGNGGGSYSGSSGQVLACNGHAMPWMVVSPAKLKSTKPAGSFKDLNATEEAVVHNVAQYEGTELVRERDGTFSYCRSGLALAKDRVKARTVNALISKKFLDVVEFGDRAEALVCKLGSNILVHGR